MRFGSLWIRLADRAILLAVVATVAMLPLGCGDTTSPAPGTAADQSTTHVRAGGPQSRTPEWSAPNADLANTRRIRSAIDAASVKQLRVAWTMPLEHSFATTPVVADDVLFTQDLQSNVYALDLEHGRLLWTKRYEAPDTGPNGVNVVGGRVFGATSTSAFALDAKSGRELWSTTLTRRPGDMIDMAPGYERGTVYVSTAVAGLGAVGTLWALDADTGRPRWRWQQVPSDLWGDPQGNAGGGLWHPPAFDGHGFLYISTANPLPFPGSAEDEWGGSRPGDNRWTNAIVKLKASDGSFVWGRQVLPHDIYDWDLEGPVMLTKVDGKLVAITAGKMGYVYMFDARTGVMRWKRAVGLHNGHDDDNLLALRGAGDQLRSPAKVLPGWWGGVESQMATDGRTAYVPVNNLYTIYHSRTKVEPQEPLEGTGEVVALDVATGRVKWDRKLPHSVYGAATLTNDLVFTTTYEGTVWALSAATGAVVWRAPLPAGSIAPVSISGDMLITGASVLLADGQRQELVAYRLG